MSINLNAAADLEAKTTKSAIKVCSLLVPAVRHGHCLRQLFADSVIQLKHTFVVAMQNEPKKLVSMVKQYINILTRYHHAGQQIQLPLRIFTHQERLIAAALHRRIKQLLAIS
eukprot:scaffold67351_cov19-Prasinocladus_malaysianus.AAC.1